MKRSRRRRERFGGRKEERTERDWGRKLPKSAVVVEEEDKIVGKVVQTNAVAMEQE